MAKKELQYLKSVAGMVLMAPSLLLIGNQFILSKVSGVKARSDGTK
jgi:hypothetical protein